LVVEQRHIRHPTQYADGEQDDISQRGKSSLY
jgi:hypothetical protein